MTEQLRVTVPLKAVEGVITKLNGALWPASIVCDVGAPDAAAIAKSAAAPPIPDKLMAWEPPAALSLMVTVPARFPAAVGVKETEI